MSKQTANPIMELLTGSGVKSANSAAAVARRTVKNRKTGRKKTSIACQYCWKSKTRCGTNRPCKRCVRLGHLDCCDRPINSRKRQHTAHKQNQNTEIPPNLNKDKKDITDKTNYLLLKDGAKRNKREKVKRKSLFRKRPSFKQHNENEQNNEIQNIISLPPIFIEERNVDVDLLPPLIENEAVNKNIDKQHEHAPPPKKKRRRNDFSYDNPSHSWIPDSESHYDTESDHDDNNEDKLSSSEDNASVVHDVKHNRAQGLDNSGGSQMVMKPHVFTTGSSFKSFGIFQQPQYMQYIPYQQYVSMYFRGPAVPLQRLPNVHSICLPK